MLENKPHHLGHRERLRERFVNDMDSMPDYEVLELLLTFAISRKDVKPIAKDLLKRFKNFSGVLGADISALEKVDGVGRATAVYIKSIHKASSLSAKSEIYKGNILSTWDKLIEYCTINMAHSVVEQFRVIFLDTRNRIILDEEQTRGTVNQTSIYPREVIKRALELNSTAVILVHNHPSGDPTPSQADIDMTKMVQDAGLLVGIKLHDHIIVGKENIVSFKTLGLI